MNAIKRYISHLFLLCTLSLATGCEDGSDLVDPAQLQEGKGDVTLSLKVSITNTVGSGTRAIFEPATISQELMNTLRIIIVREDNTVEYNQLITMPAGVGLDKLGEIEYPVSTSLGERVYDAENKKFTQTEKKRIYLIANEGSIPDSPQAVKEVKNFLVDLKPGYYKTVEADIDGLKGEFSEYVPGETFTPENAKKLMIWNSWGTENSGSASGTLAEYAEPFIDNEGKDDRDKKFVLMTEFFDIEVTSNLSIAGKQVQRENLFITRNLVKFQFSIGATPETPSFKVKKVVFQNLMQKEYLFPFDMTYAPAKYTADNKVIVEDREITEYTTPGYQIDNLVRKYVFEPNNFGFNGTSSSGENKTSYASTYTPELYFCETKNIVADNGKESVFDVTIEVEYPYEETVLDSKGNPVKDEEGNIVTQPVTLTFTPQTLNLPYSLPRNTIVQVNMSLGNANQLTAEVVLVPYLGVSLNPWFGFE